MIKEEINSHIQYMESLIQDLDHNTAINGRNKAKSKRMSANINVAITLFENYLNNNPALSKALQNYHPNSLGYNETLSFVYFLRDIPRFINYLKALIEE